MKTSPLVVSAVAAAFVFQAWGANPSANPSEKPPRETPMVNPPPPVVTLPGTPAPGSIAYVYDQKPIGGRAPLVSPEQAKAVIDRFRTGYPKLGGPRFVVFVNRELIDETSGLKITGRKERTENLKSDLSSTANYANGGLGQTVTVVGNVAGAVPHQPLKGTSEVVAGENEYKQAERSERTLADRQTIRDVERLAGRPLRLAGAKLVDQRVATQLVGDRSIQDFLGTTGSPSAAREREALMGNADVVIEILMSSRPVTYAGISQDVTYGIPDIQATAIRLSNAQILGQASTRDIMGPDGSAQRIVRNYDIHEITEAVSLALMEDMMQTVQ
ncbi:MAG TPA: hypothetical protein VMF06_20360 [Candidatus Limnocylindria bacterium]|jgi:hypothetical protein|nr:hypothetical protein [Candidatus Limnocylindria bacterium]